MSVTIYIKSVLIVVVNQKVHNVQPHPEHNKNNLLESEHIKSLTLKNNIINKTSNQRHPPIPNENHLDNDLRLNRRLRYITDIAWGYWWEGVQCQRKEAQSFLTEWEVSEV